MSYYFDRDEYNKLIEKYNYKEMIHDSFKHVLTPEFKKHGFKKKGKTFYREREGIVEICEVQYSSGNHRTTAKFRYNIYIASPFLYSKLNVEENKLDTIICGLDFGEVIYSVYNLPGMWGYWYKLEAYSTEKPTPVYPSGFSKEDIEKQEAFELHWESRYNIKTGEGFHEVLVRDIENVILPFFQSIPDAETLIEHLENNEPKGYIEEQMMFQVGHLFYDNGEQEKGRQILNRIRNGIYKEQIENKVKLGRIVL